MNQKETTYPSPYCIGLVENDPEFREEVTRHLSHLDFIKKPVHSWASAELFLHDQRRKELDLVFVDIMMSGITSIELIKILQQKQPELKTVILSNMNSDELIFDAIKYGTLGYILKSELGNLADAVRTIMSGGALITPTIALRVMSSFRNVVETAPALTGRERQILELLVRGKTVRNVAEFLDLSAHTVHGYIKSIYKKLEVHNRAELVLRAQELSLL